MKSAAFTYSLLVVFLFLLTSILPAAPANAQEASLHITFTVNTTADRHDANWGDRVCADQQGQCSLRAAIEEADALPYGSTATIVVPVGTYLLLKGTLRLSAHRSIKINGASSKTTIIEGNKTFRIMSIGSPSLFVQLSQLTIEGGKAVGGNGGGIENFGTLMVSNSTIRGNSTTNSYDGGGIANFGTLTVSNSSVSNNTATSGFGGGIDNEGTLTVSNSTIIGNFASGGGGIENCSKYSTMSVSNSTISGNSAYYGGGIENCSKYSTMSVSNSTLNDNSATYDGGGIDNLSALTVSGSTLSGNSATTGGGIYNETGGTLSMSNSTLNGNSAYYGGSIYNGVGGTLSVSNSTLSNNPATYDGGGIDNEGALTVSGSTLSGNSATTGGGIDNEGTLTVSNSTLSGNSAVEAGGGLFLNDNSPVSISNSTLSGNQGGNIYNYRGTITLTGTIVANSTGAPNCSGTITDMGYNLDSDGSCGFTQSSDLNKVDPLLGPLQNNGGPTQTMALLQGSKAIDWVNNSADCPATDQRGDVRPDNGESACDIGAYESAY